MADPVTVVAITLELRVHDDGRVSYLVDGSSVTALEFHQRLMSTDNAVFASWLAQERRIVR